MPRTDWDPKNKAKTGRLDYPTLKLGKGEQARIVVMEQHPFTEFVHNIEAPILDDNGQPVMVTKNFGKNSSREVIDKSFVGRHRCFGRFEVLRDKGSDPEQCPTCKAARDGEGIEPPLQYFVAHVFRYATRPGTFTPQEPMSGQLLAWKINAKRWNELIDLCVEHGADDKPRDIRSLDLTLGPCTNEGWQQYDIKAGAHCRWRKDKTSQAFVAEVYRNNKAEDLSPLIAPVVSLEQARDDIRAVQAKYDVMNGRVAPVASSAEEAHVGKAVDEILGDVLGGEPADEQASSDELDDVLGGIGDGADADGETDDSQDDDTRSEPTAPGSSTPPPTSEPSGDAEFDDLLQGLDV